MPTTSDDANLSSGSNLKNDLVPKLEMVYRRPSDLKASKNKVRKVKPKHIARVGKSVERFGFCKPVQLKGDEIIDGHVQVAAALHLGLETIPCIDIQHLSDDDIKLLRISLNKIQERGTWDEVALRLEFA